MRNENTNDGTPSFGELEAEEPRPLSSNVSDDEERNFVIEVSIDAAGRRTLLRDNSGYQVHYAYDQAGNLQTVSDRSGQELVRYTFDSLHRLTRETKSNGTATDYSFDSSGRMMQVIHRDHSGDIQASFVYEVDSRNRRTSVTIESLSTFEFTDVELALLTLINRGRQDPVASYLNLIQSIQARLEGAVADASPSMVAIRNEELSKLAIGQKQLLANAREVLIEWYFNYKLIWDIASSTGRTWLEVAGLRRRGLPSLRENFLLPKKLRTDQPFLVPIVVPKPVPNFLDSPSDLGHSDPDSEPTHEPLLDKEPSRSERVSEIIKLLDAKPAEDFEVASKGLEQLLGHVRTEIAERLTPLINAKLQSMPSVEYEDKKQICHWLNNTLRLLSLAIRGPNGLPSILVASSDRREGTFRIKESTEVGPKRFASSSVSLPQLELMAAVPRIEPITRHRD